MDMSQRIKTLRTQQGMTLEELGKKVGVGKSTVRKWETGMIENMRRDKISKIADALGVSPSYLMGWEEEEVKTNTYTAVYGELVVAVELFDSLDEEGRQRAIDYMEMLKKIYKKEESHE